jgi:exonuclease SbcC
MKILAIRGKNLASLSNEFAVDFQSEPLATAGLYAITGATGAGKSTLLDALCLALYGNTPRLARSTLQGETIPDVGENSVGPTDPRTLLRRGASEGFAEVDFIGSDLVAYRARWSVRRARNRADGKLQASDLSLLRLADRQPLTEHRKSETLKLIERCIGLSFEQFTRAVLLAQNDFAAFLKSSDDERAELLQTLTGTETFTHLSMQAFARAKEENEALKLLTLQLADQAPLNAEARLAKTQELAGQTAQLNALEQRKSALEAHVRWQQQREKLQANEAEAAARHTQAQQAKAQAAERSTQFACIEAVQAARPLCSEVERLQRETELGASTLKQQRTQAQQAVQFAEARKAPLDAAILLLQKAEQAKSEAQPAIDRVKAFDAQIAALAPNLQRALKERDAGQQLLRQEEARRSQRQNELTHTQAALQAAQGWLLENARTRPLAEGWPRWEMLFSQAAQRQAEHQQTQAKWAELRQEESEIGKALAQERLRHAALATGYQGAVEKLEELSRACAAFQPEERRKRQQELETRRELLAQASQLWQDLGEQQQRLQHLAAQRQIHTRVRQECVAQLAECAAAQPPAERDLANAEKSLRLAELARSENVEQMRALLTDADPCPVCGAQEHPYAQHNPALDAVLTVLRQEVDRLRQIRNARVQRAATAQAGQQSAEQQIAQIERDSAVASSALQTRQQQWAALPLSEENAFGAGSDVAAQLSEQQAALKARLAQLGNEEAAYRTTLQQKDGAQIATDKAQAARVTAQHVLTQRELAYQKSVQSCQTARDKRDELALQLTTALSELDAAFPAADGLTWREAWGNDAAAFSLQCASAVHAWTTQQRQVGELNEKINAIAAAIQGALHVIDNATRHLANQSAQCAQLERDLQARQAARKEALSALRVLSLLGDRAVGEVEDVNEVNEVEAHFSAQIEQGRAALSEQQKAQQQADAARARGEEAVRQTAAHLEKNQALLKTAEQTLADWRQAFTMPGEESRPIGPDALNAWLAFTPSWIHAERQSLQALENAIATTHAVLKEHRSAHLAHRSARPLEKWIDATAETAETTETAEATATTTETLRAALLNTLADLGPLKVQAAALQLALAHDDQCRQKSQSLLAEVEKQSAQAHVWAQLGELIGSADGKKFRNFAQQLTLDILLGYANRHLESLSRRYRLQRIKASLGLLVVDRDMGDEVRSVHSLSGGESFLVSLALALGLASLSSHRVQVESLFIDEGFGSLDNDALVVAMEALDCLQAQGRKVGVISHVQEMTERIGTRIQVQRLAGGQSHVSVVG